MAEDDEIPWPEDSPAPDENPRVERRRPLPELVRAVREGRAINDAMRALDARSHEPDEHYRALAEELARFLVRRAADGHHGWQVLRQVLLDAGAEVPWDQCERRAFGPTTERIIADAAEPGRTPLHRVQHAAAQERARAVAPHVDPVTTLRRLEIPAREVDPETWERALVAAVRARSREKAMRLLLAEL